MQDRDLNEYNPSTSTTSKHLSCSHQFCESGPYCKSPQQPCPYIVNYYSENTSSSGMLVEDILHLSSAGDPSSNSSLHAAVILGCGRKQSGGYLDGVAPDGLLGLGLGEISVPSFLAKTGVVHNSFSMCFDEEGSGRIYFGDQGIASQDSTPFLPLDGKYKTYIIGVEAGCVGSSCLQNTSFRTLVDSGTSFTFLPEDVYQKVVQEFDKRINATRSSYEGYPWKYCYKSSSEEVPAIPSVRLMFAQNNSFVVRNAVFLVYGNQGVDGFCLAIQPADGDMGTIGQNFMTGYRMVFDREKLKLGWSSSNCQDLAEEKIVPSTPPPNGRPPNPLPTDEQQRTPTGDAVSPAVAGKAPSKPSAASSLQLSSSCCCLLRLLLILLGLLVVVI